MRPFALLAVLVVPFVARADAVYVSLTPRALIGKGLPAVNVQIQEPIAGFRLLLTRSDGKTVDIKGGGRPGQTRVLELAQPEGTFGYKGELAVNLPNAQSFTMPLEFEASLLGPLRIKVEKGDVDIAKRSLRFRLNRAAAKAHLKVIMDTGRTVMDDDVMLGGAAPGTPIELSWPQAPGKVMKMALQGFDAEGFFDGVELSPWQVDIPHEEVNFDTGKWDIRPNESPKLDKSLGLIQDAVAKYGTLAELRLYVAGHTDTVGDSASNRTLSLNRARSIGAYFRKKGLRIAIFYDGFGEEALAVPTADETDEARNRRAEYIIAIENPNVERAPVPPRWQRL